MGNLQYWENSIFGGKNPMVSDEDVPNSTNPLMQRTASARRRCRQRAWGWFRSAGLPRLGETARLDDWASYR